MDSIKNNIFTYATKELSQDAFLCWLLSFYNVKKSPLFSFAKKVIGFIIKDFSVSFPDSIDDIRLQENHRDITIYFSDKKTVVFIEDKVSSGIKIGDDSSQIDLYYADLKKDFSTVIPVFFKTGYVGEHFSELTAIEKRINTSIVKLTQKEINKLFFEKSNNVILKQWQDHFSRLYVNDVIFDDAQSIPLILSDFEHDDLRLKQVKLKLMNELCASILKAKNTDVSHYGFGRWGPSCAVYGWIYCIPENKSYEVKLENNKIQLAKMFDKVRFSKKLTILNKKNMKGKFEIKKDFSLVSFKQIKKDFIDIIKKES